MKKLMTMIGVAAMAFGLYADGFKYNQTNFKDTPLGVLDITKNDAGADTAPFYWAGDAGDSEVKAVSEAEGAAKFLAIDNSEPLYRTVNSGPDAAAQEISNTGLFADMFVKFTASEAAEPIVLADGAKLGIWVAADDEAETPATNLMVCAASLVNGATVPVATNFTIAVDADFDFTAEHRVTIRAIDEISSGKLKMAGFVLYIDEKLVAAADADYAEKVGFDAFNAVAAPFYAKKQLFVSLVEAGTLSAQKITGVGFKGSGELAKIAITDNDNAPEFAQIKNSLTLTWDKDAIKSLMVGGEPVDVSMGEQIFPLGGLTELTVSVVKNDGYMTPTFADVKNAKYDSGKFVNILGVAEAKIVAKAVAFTIGDEPFATFEDALKAAETGDTIKLAQSIGGWEHPVVIDDADVDVILDLNGKTLTFDNYLDEDMFEVFAGKLTVIDSGNGGKIAATEAAESAGFYGVFYAEGDGIIQIGLDEGDNGVTVDGLVGDGLTILKGKFLNIPDEQGKEDIQNFIPGEGEGDYEVVADGNYWKVQKKQAEKGTVLLITNAGTTTNDYQTLALALAAAQSGDIVMPTATIAELQTTITVNKGVTLDLNNQIVNVDFHQTKLSNAGKIVIYKNSLALVNNWYIGGNFEAGEELTDGSNFVFPKGTQMDVAKQTAVQTAITITGDIQWGLPIESNKLVTVVGTAEINAKIYPTATLTVPNEIKEPTLTTIDGFEVKSTVGETTTTWAAEEKQEEDWDVPEDEEDAPASEVWPAIAETPLADVPAGKLSTWAKANGIKQDAEFTADMVDAYALNCAPAELEAKKAEAVAAIEITSITYDAEKGEWVITTKAGEDGDAYGANGELKLVEITDQIKGVDAENAKLWKMTIVPAAAK